MYIAKYTSWLRPPLRARGLCYVKCTVEKLIFLEFAHVLASNRENELLFADQAQMNWLQELARQKPA